MAKKYYAVRRGKATGIFGTWDECKDSVHGYPGAEYKSFGTKEEALDYLGASAGKCGGIVPGDSGEIAGVSCAAMRGQRTDTGSKSSASGSGAAGKAAAGRTNPGGKAAGKAVKKSAAAEADSDQRRGSADELVAYVDGSYNAATKEFSYGVVLLLEDDEIRFSEKMNDRGLAEMHNVAGEIKGAEAAMRYALEHGYQKVVIHHDYEGIAKWCLGQWKTNKDGTKAYKAFYDSIRNQLRVEFVKVKGHSNDKYNDVADELAKEALGIL